MLKGRSARQIPGGRRSWGVVICSCCCQNGFSGSEIVTISAYLQIFRILSWYMQEVRKSQNQDLRADPVWSTNSEKVESNPRDFPVFRHLWAAASSSGLKGSEILWPSSVGIFHRSDSSLLTSLVDSRASRSASNLLMVLHPFRIECEKSMELTVSTHRSYFLCSRQDSRDEAALSDSVPTGARVKER